MHSPRDQLEDGDNSKIESESRSMEMGFSYVENKSIDERQSPRNAHQLQEEYKKELLKKKQRNEANQRLSKFKKFIEYQKDIDKVQTMPDKIKMLPDNLEDDLDEAILYVYFTVRNDDEAIFKIIRERSNFFQANKEYFYILGREGVYNQLKNENNAKRYKLNQIAFAVALEKDYVDVAYHFIQFKQVHITWDMIRRMINRKQEYLVKKCIKYGLQFDPGSASLKKIVFAGRSAAAVEDRTIKLVDFLQVMVELKWKSKQIMLILQNYNKRGKIDSTEMKEMFLMFAVKRKIKLMSFLINDDNFDMEFQEENFIDVIENEAYDVAVLLYREYFLLINKNIAKINNLLINSFEKSNGMLESKAYLLKRFLSKMTFEQANKFLYTIEQRVFDSSKSNILMITLNVIKASCLLIELLEKIRSNFSFLSRRVYEVRSKIIKIAQEYMNDIQSEEEMRFLLLEKDLDDRDGLNIIYDYDIVDLLRHPFAQNIVQQIWSSQYNNSHSVFTASSVHKLLFNYNHCRYDLENKLRFYRPRDLKNYECHGFQFQVWRYSGESRHVVQTVTTWLFIIWMHVLIRNHINYVNFILDNSGVINLSIDRWNEVRGMNANSDNYPPQSQVEIINQLYNLWVSRLFQFEQQAMNLTFLMFIAWLFLFQKIYDAIFAGKNKRIPHMVNGGNFLDFMVFIFGIVYIAVVYKDWRYDTWLRILSEEDQAKIYWQNYQVSVVNENVLLLIYGIILWMKAFYQLKLISITGSLFAIMVKLFSELLIFAVFYFSQLFLYAVVGVVLFNDLEEFSQLSTALFTMFRATIQDYDIDQMNEARVGPLLGYIYFISFLILNLTLIVNLIVGQLSYAYKYYSQRRGLLMLLQTLSVREVQEADEKYSAVISAPFPLTFFNFLFGSIVVSMKSPEANQKLLLFYFMPVAVITLVIFIVYQFLMLPLCYVKMIFHKFALVVKSPQGQGAKSTCDRFFATIIFIVLGPMLLILSSIVDIFWFLKHMFMMELDESHLQQKKTPKINRRTYKKMNKYFNMKNEQLVPQNKVAEDLRKELDVMFGIQCLIYGRPTEIPKNKQGMYISYAKNFLQNAQGKKSEAFNDDITNVEVENVVDEYQLIRQVLLNNSFPVDMQEIDQNQMKQKGWGTKLLFDKKVFYIILQDLERMRKLLNLKKCFFIFHIPYDGKPKDMDKWHKKVETRINTTLKFLNTARLLKIIGYDPTLHIRADNINMTQDLNQSFNKLYRQPSMKKNEINTLDQIMVEPKMDAQSSTIQKARFGNVKQNLYYMINKYTNAGKQMKELADIMKKLNTNNASQDRRKIQQSSQKENSNQIQSNKSPNQHSRQLQVNYHSPSRVGVISPPLSQRKLDKQSMQKKDTKVENLDSSRSEAVVPSDEDDRADKFKKNKEEFSMIKNQKKKK